MDPHKHTLSQQGESFISVVSMRGGENGRVRRQRLLVQKGFRLGTDYPVGLTILAGVWRYWQTHTMLLHTAFLTLTFVGCQLKICYSAVSKAGGTWSTGGVPTDPFQYRLCYTTHSCLRTAFPDQYILKATVQRPCGSPLRLLSGSKNKKKTNNFPTLHFAPFFSFFFSQGCLASQPSVEWHTTHDGETSWYFPVRR
jgi:hypothetical protein